MGVIFACGVIGAGVAQYPGGRLADRAGPKPVIVLALLVYSLLFLVYLLPIPLLILVPVRFAHAFFAGVYRPAAAAMLADLSSDADRGHAFGLLRAADTSGLLIGPVLGGLLATYRLEAIFLAGFGLCLLATGLMLRLPAVAVVAPVGPRPPRHPLRLARLLAPVLVLSLPINWVFGNYDAVWSLYLTGLHASRFQVGLSFAVYALPIMLLSGWLGRAGDRFGYRPAAILAVASYAVMNTVYTLSGNVWLLIWLGVVEGGFTAAGTPALAAEVSRGAPPGQQGRTQGAYGGASTLVQAVAALAGGALFGISPRYPFLAATAVCGLGLALALVIRPSGRG